MAYTRLPQASILFVVRGIADPANTLRPAQPGSGQATKKGVQSSVRDRRSTRPHGRMSHSHARRATAPGRSSRHARSRELPLSERRSSGSRSDPPNSVIFAARVAPPCIIAAVPLTFALPTCRAFASALEQGMGRRLAHLRLHLHAHRNRRCESFGPAAGRLEIRPAKIRTLAWPTAR